MTFPVNWQHRQNLMNRSFPLSARTVREDRATPFAGIMMTTGRNRTAAMFDQKCRAVVMVTHGRRTEHPASTTTLLSVPVLWASHIEVITVDEVRNVEGSTIAMHGVPYFNRSGCYFRR